VCSNFIQWLKTYEFGPKMLFFKAKICVFILIYTINLDKANAKWVCIYLIKHGIKIGAFCNTSTLSHRIKEKPVKRHTRVFVNNFMLH